jgi:hypothetical protein
MGKRQGFEEVFCLHVPFIDLDDFLDVLRCLKYLFAQEDWEADEDLDVLDVERDVSVSAKIVYKRFRSPSPISDREVLDQETYFVFFLKKLVLLVCVCCWCEKAR